MRAHRAWLAAGLALWLLGSGGLALAAPPIVWTDTEGRTHATDKPPRRDQVTEAEWRRLQSAPPPGEGRVQVLPDPTPTPAPGFVPAVRRQAEGLWAWTKRTWSTRLVPALAAAWAWAGVNRGPLVLGLRVLAGLVLLWLLVPRLRRSARELRVLGRLPERAEPLELAHSVGRRVLLVGRPKRATAHFDVHGRNCVYFRQWTEVRAPAAADAGAPEWHEARVDELEAPDFFLETGGERVRVTLGKVTLREARHADGAEETDEAGVRTRQRSAWVPYSSLQITAAGRLERQDEELVLLPGPRGVELWPRALDTRTRRQLSEQRRRLLRYAALLAIGLAGTAGPWLW
jgi:hypothetical protein